MNEWIGLALVFLVTTGSAFLLLARSLRRERIIQERLAKGDSAADADPPLLLGAITPALAEQIPISANMRAELQKDLRAAGYYRPTALMEYAALRAVLVLVPFFVAGLVALSVPNSKITLVLCGGLVIGLLGYSVPRLYIYVRGKRRSREIEHGLPVAVDLLTLCLTGGQNVVGALQRVAGDLRHSYPVLAQELTIVQQQAALRSPEQALQQWPERVQVPEVRNLAMLLTQSERLGTDASSALMEFADNFRVNLKQRAEAQANRTSFWMIFPTVSCLFIAAGIILVGPGYLDFWQQQQEARKLLAKDQQNVKRAAPRAPATRPERTERPASATPQTAAQSR
jgi:pilus assembly protein TadC